MFEVTVEGSKITLSSEHTVKFLLAIVGLGFNITLKLKALPKQPFAFGVIE